MTPISVIATTWLAYLKTRASVLILLCLSLGSASAAENLVRSDLVGEWKSNYPTTKGEENSLVFSPDMNVQFTRDLSGEYPDQEHTASSDQVSFVDDLVIIRFQADKYGQSYKLVLSGWKSTNTKALFGTMYMYRGDNLFNGLPITFRKETSGE